MVSVGNDGMVGQWGGRGELGDPVGLNLMQCIDGLHGCIS